MRWGESESPYLVRNLMQKQYLFSSSTNKTCFN